MTRDEALAAARLLAPRLRERAEPCAADRRAPEETIEAFRSSGLSRLVHPIRYGGYDLGWDVFCEVTEILAAACGSQAWVYWIHGGHAQMLGLFPDQAQQDVWGVSADARASASFTPVGKGTPVEGGYRYSGKHAFCSGIDYAQWLILGGVVEDPDNPGKRVANYFLVPKSDGTVIDDWFVNGLDGTGSKSFEVKDVFVPSHRLLNWDDAAAGRGPGRAVNHAPVSRLPRGGYTTSSFAALAVGMVQGMLSDWLDLMASRRSGGALVAGSESTQILAAGVDAQVAAARALYMNTIKAAMKDVEAGQVLPPSRAMEARCNVAFACKMMVEAAQELHAAMGSAAVYAGNPLERQFRNLLTGMQHFAVMWPRVARDHGAEILRQHGSPLAAQPGSID